MKKPFVLSVLQGVLGRWVWCGLFFPLAYLGGYASEPDLHAAVPLELKKMSIEELMSVEVTSAGRKAQKVSTVASAMDVIPGDEIRRSGAPNIPGVLRLSSGLHVAQTDSHTWGITARGFNLTTANKLHVLMDGRSLYTPLFAGVFWDVQDTFLEDIDRVEVIRGPGAAMWGANAVNGVINITTKNAKDTQGTLVTSGGGSEERGFGAVRYGGRAGERTYYRAYAKFFSRDELVLPNGRGAGDDWAAGQTEFRLDSEISDYNLLTAQGDLYYGEIGQLTENDIELGGGNLLGRWTHAFSSESELQLQGSYTFLQKDLNLESSSMDPTRGASEGNDPHHLFSVHSMMSLTAHWELDCILRFVDTLPEPHVPSYLVMDVRLAWRPRPDLEFALIARNLLDDQHPEFGPDNALRKEVPHSLYAKLTWSF